MKQNYIRSILKFSLICGLILSIQFFIDIERNSWYDRWATAITWARCLSAFCIILLTLIYYQKSFKNIANTKKNIVIFTLLGGFSIAITTCFFLFFLIVFPAFHTSGMRALELKIATHHLMEQSLNDPKFWERKDIILRKGYFLISHDDPDNPDFGKGKNFKKEDTMLSNDDLSFVVVGDSLIGHDSVVGITLIINKNYKDDVGNKNRTCIVLPEKYSFLCRYLSSK